MTINVGILCSDGLILASDSQAGSNVGVSVKRLDYTKIYAFPIPGKGCVVVAGAGVAAYISRAVELLQEMCEEHSGELRHPRDVANLAEDAMIELTKRYVVDRSKALGVYRNGQSALPFAPAEFQDESNLPACMLMLGVDILGEQALYLIYPDGVAEKGERYMHNGSGSAFAEYLLARLCREELTTAQAARAAIYVVEEVKKIDPDCGGPTRVAVVGKGKARLLPDAELARIAADIQEQDARLSEALFNLVARTEAAKGK